MANFTNGFESGTNGAAISTANSGGASGNAFDSVTSLYGTTVDYSNVTSAHGALSAYFTGPDGYVTWGSSFNNGGAGVSQVWFRAYLYLQTMGTTSVIMPIGFDSTSFDCGVIEFDGAGNVYVAQASNGYVSGPVGGSIPNNTWFRVEGFIVGSASLGQLEVKVWYTNLDSKGTPDVTYTSSPVLNTIGPIETANFGIYDYGGASTTPPAFYMDDVAMSTSGYIGPVNNSSGLLMALFP